MTERDRRAQELREREDDPTTVATGLEGPGSSAGADAVKTAEDAEFERQMAIGLEVMRRYETVLAALAK